MPITSGICNLFYPFQNERDTRLARFICWHMSIYCVNKSCITKYFLENVR